MLAQAAVLADWTWNPVDLTVVVLLAFGLVGGLLKGFTWQIVRLAFLVLAFWAAARFSAPVGRYVGSATGELVDDSIERGLAYTLLFAGVYLGSIPVALWLRNGIAKLRLKSYDRMIGGLLGMAKSTAVAYVALIVLIYLAPRVLSKESRLEATVRSSLAYEAVSRAHPTLAGIFPPEFHERVAEFRARVEDELDLPDPDTDSDGADPERAGEDPLVDPAGPGLREGREVGAPSLDDPSVARGRGARDGTLRDAAREEDPADGVPGTAPAAMRPHSLERSQPPSGPDAVPDPEGSRASPLPRKREDAEPGGESPLEGRAEADETVYRE